VVRGLAAVYNGGMQVRRDHAENDLVRREMIKRSRSARKYGMGMWARRSTKNAWSLLDTAPKTATMH